MGVQLQRGGDAWGRLATRAQGRKNFTTEGTEDTEKEKIMARGVGADVRVYRYGEGWDSVVNKNGSGTVLGAWVMTRGTRGKKLAYVTGGLQGAQGRKNFTTEGTKHTEKEKIMARGVGADVRVYCYGAGWDSVVNKNGSGTVLGAWVMTLADRGKKLAYIDGGLQGAAPIYTYSDHLGSIRRARLQDVSSVGSDEFEPYGGVYASTGTLSALKLRYFALHPEDTALQGYRAPFRVYSPVMARWTTEDPLGMADGTNVYSYVGGHVVSKNDKTGLSAVIIDGTILIYLMANRSSCAQQVYCVAKDMVHSEGISSDNNNHCRVACEITKICGGGAISAALANIWYELGTNLAGGDSTEDTVAAAYGGHYGTDLDCNDNKSCKERCDKRFDPNNSPDAGNYK